MKHKSADDNREYYEQGREAMKNANFRVAIEKLTRSAETVPHFKTFELIGESYLLLDEPRKAILYLAGAAGLGNRAFRAFYLLAKALLKLGDASAAREKLQQAIAMNPNYREATELLDSLGVQQ